MSIHHSRPIPAKPARSPLSSIEPRLNAFLSRLMLRTKADDSDEADDDFERLDVLDGLHRAVRRSRYRR